MLIDLRLKLKMPVHDSRYRTLLQSIHIDGMLLAFILLLASAGLMILYSASNQNIRTIEYQIVRLLFSFAVMFIVAQISPFSLQRWAPWLYALGLTMLISVLGIGHIGKGAQRWLNVGVMRFQPAELMKVALPLLLAWYYHKKDLPITLKSVLICGTPYFGSSHFNR